MTDQVLPIRKFSPSEVLEPKVLGGLLDNGAALKPMLAAAGLSEVCFPSMLGRKVWRLIVSLVNEGAVVSALTVISAGKLRKQLADDECRWVDQLAAENVVGPEQLAQVLNDLRRAARALELVTLFDTTKTELLQHGLDENRVWAALAQAKAMLNAEQPDATGTMNLLATLDRWERLLRDGRAPMVPSGVKLFDEAVGGYPHSLTLLVAAPGAGKNGLIAGGIRAQLEADPAAKVGLAALEGKDTWLHARQLAKEMGLKVREVGALKTPIDIERRASVAQGMAPWLDRVLVHTPRLITPADLIRRATQWVAKGCTSIYIDNASHLDLKQTAAREEPWRLLATALHQLTEFAEEYQVAVVLLMHVNEEGGKKHPGRESPPEMGQVRGGRASEQQARLVWGLWQKADSWRATLLKGNELAKTGITVQFDTFPEAALVDPGGGHFVNLRAEKAMEEREKSEEAMERRAAKTKADEVARLKAKAEAKAEVQAAGQAALPLEEP